MKRTFLPLILLASLSSTTLAAPNPSVDAEPITINLRRRAAPNRDSTWYKHQVAKLRSKYGGGTTSDSSSTSSDPSKRAVGTNELVNQNTDSSYYGTLAVGTPPTSYDVILDTGSSDFWLAEAGCRTCGAAPAFDPTTSSTFKNLSKPFAITYGSGQAAGTLGQDTVQMAGFKVEGQTFALCDSVSTGLLNEPVSGLLGLGFQTIATSGATPFWETLVKSNAFTLPLFSFYLTRFIDIPDASTQEVGGQFMLGGTNTSLYTGSVEFIDIPDGEESYWVIPIKTLSVQGNELVFPTTSVSHAAIDTGTTLVGGPQSAIASVYAQIPGSVRGTGDYESYWFYPCTTEVNIAISFGNSTWSINPEDFVLGRLNRQQCIGAFFELSMGGSAPSWIIGDTFLKNVYSVYRYSPPSVGFAQLSTGVESLYAVGQDLPSATIGANPASATGSSTRSSSRNAAMRVGYSGLGLGLGVVAGFVLALAGLGWW